MIDNPPENIVYFYSEYQDTLTEIKLLVHCIEFQQVIPPNATYLVLIKNVRDTSQLIYLAKQLYPQNVKYF